MILCPKCGFEQPEDVYCAKCGVNMSTFKGASRPKSLMIVVIGLGLIAFGLVVTKLTTSLKNFDNTITQIDEQRIEDLERGTVSAPTANAPSHNKSAVKPSPLLNLAKKETPKPEQQQLAFAPMAPGNQPISDTNVPLKATTTEKSPTENSTPTQQDSKITNQLSIQFYLIGKEATEKLRLSMGALSSNNFSKSTYQEIIKDTQTQTLGSETHALNLNQVSTYTQGTQEPKTRGFIGFVIDVTALRITDAQADYKILIKRSLPEVTPAGELTIQTADIQENISMTAGQVTAISGLLNRKNLLENEDSLYSGNILRALIDPEFQKFEQEFVVLFVP